MSPSNQVFIKHPGLARGNLYWTKVQLPYSILFNYNNGKAVFKVGVPSLRKKENTMAKKEKRLCKWEEDDISKKFDKFITIVSDPKFVCKKCGRVADKKKWLHKPVPLK